MYVVAVAVHVKSDQVEAFIEATLANARASRQEAGNARFDVLQQDQDPTRFLLYEAYLDQKDFVRHQQTAHYLKWKAAVADMMAQPRQGLKHKSLFFGEAEG